MKHRQIISKAKFLQIADRVLEASTARETEVLFSQEISSLTRYANNVVHQNLSHDDIGVSVRAVVGKRQGRFSTTRLDKAGLKNVAELAVDTARSQKAGEEFLSLPGPQTYQGLQGVDRKTADLGPMDRVKHVKKAVSTVRRKKLEAAGMLTHSAVVQGVANSKGLRAYHASTSARFSVTAMGETSSGWSETMCRRVREIDVDRIARNAADTAVAGQEPNDLPAGKYTVILHPEAMTDFLLFMGWFGFGGLTVLDGRSFMSGKIGKRILGRKITISDDVYHPKTIGFPFDYEGMPRKRVVLIDKGVARQAVHDRYTARLAKTRSTGHALPQPNSHGPIPMNLVMEPGDSSLEEMIASTDRGILVHQFHYTNVADPNGLLLTGMTRNGTFLIEKGKVVKPIKNLRFTESAVRALSDVEALTKEQKFCGSFFGGAFVVPGAKIREFSFSSTTPF